MNKEHEAKNNKHFWELENVIKDFLAMPYGRLLIKKRDKEIHIEKTELSKTKLT